MDTQTTEHHHVWTFVGDEYGGLAGGGDYEVYECACGKRKYEELAD